MTLSPLAYKVTIYVAPVKNKPVSHGNFSIKVNEGVRQIPLPLPTQNIIAGSNLISVVKTEPVKSFALFSVGWMSRNGRDNLHIEKLKIEGINGTREFCGTQTPQRLMSGSFHPFFESTCTRRPV